MNETTTTGTNDVWFEGAFMRVLVDTKDSGGAISMMEHWYPADWSPPLHVHHREDQVLYILEGEIRATTSAGSEITLHAGESAFLPRDVPHTFITGQDGAKLLEINTPGGFEQFHVEAGEPALELRIPDPKEVDVPKLVAAIEPYEAEFVGAPMS
jgi:quercetin dioxygenase-like cupin family protein